MVGENDRSTFIPIQEYLSLHAVKAQFDSNVDGVVIFAGDLFDSIFDIQLIWQRRNIRRTTYGNRNTSNTISFGKKAFIHKPCNMIEHVIIGTAGNHITI